MALQTPIVGEQKSEPRSKTYTTLHMTHLHWERYHTKDIINTVGCKPEQSTLGLLETKDVNETQSN